MTSRGRSGSRSRATISAPAVTTSSRHRGAAQSTSKPDSNHSTFNGRVELLATRDASFFVSGSYFYEARNNGTPLQINHTGTGSGAVGGRLGTVDEGEWRFAVFADTQEFRSTFSGQAADRNSETLALDQRVPSTSAGGALQWSHRFGPNILSAGGDTRWVQGETDERVYNAGAFVRNRDAGGQQFIAGVFLQDVYTPIPALEIVGGIRGDYWYSYDGSRHDTPPAAGVPAEQTFNNIERLIPSGRLAVLYHATPTTDIRASAYENFRVPTLNEQYRVFRVRNDVTVANESLRPERSRWGAGRAAALGAVRGPGHRLLERRARSDRERDALLAPARLPGRNDVPAASEPRPRAHPRHRDRARAPPAPRLARPRELPVRGRARRERAAAAGLEGKRLAQVPENGVTATVRFSRPSWFDASVTGRYVGQQYEDDLNTLSLGGYFVLDAIVSRAITKNVELYVAAENIFDRVYSTGRTTDGVSRSASRSRSAAACVCASDHARDRIVGH